MKLSTSTILQIAVWFVAVAPELVKIVPPDWAHGILMTAGLVSIYLHRGAGKSNPDGTPAVVAPAATEQKASNPS